MVDHQALRDKHMAVAHEAVCGAGGVFETTEEEVLGETHEVFVNRARSLREYVEQTANFDEREFLVLEDQRLTYQEFRHQVWSAAKALHEDFGVQKGDRVAILAANCPEWAVAFYAAASIGAIVSAFNGWWTPAEIEYGIQHSTPKVLIGDAPRLMRLEEIAKLPQDLRIINIDGDFVSLLRHAPDATAPQVPIDEDDPALILYTSGTTGRSKGALISHRGLIGFVQTAMVNGYIRGMAEANLQKDLAAKEGREPPTSPEPPPQTIVMGTSPLFHVSGLHAGILMNIVIGGKIIYRRGRFDPEHVLQLIEKEKITSFSSIGSMATRVIRHPNFHKYDISSLRTTGSGGSPTSPALQQLLRDSFPTAAASLGAGYGSSESTAVITNIGGSEYLERPESCGRIGVGMEIEIRDENGQPLPTTQEGEIHCRSAYTMLKYWDNPEATTQTIKPGRWLATGDIGHLDEDGYLYINSRARDMILRNAENIYPIEIEYRLDSHPDVEESAVVGVDHPEMGQEVKAVVVPIAQQQTQQQTQQQLTEEQLSAWCAETLASYKVPTIWEIRTEPLPRNAAGKLMKADLAN